VTRDKKTVPLILFITGTRARDTFVEAVREVLADDSFKIKSGEAIEAREVAQSLLEWCLSEENKATFISFAVSGEFQQTVYSCKKIS